MSNTFVLFFLWAKGCQTRMGFILKENIAISIYVMLSPWTFVNEGHKLKFSDTNEIILNRIEAVKDNSMPTNSLGLNAFEIREDFSKNSSLYCPSYHPPYSQ
jgi:hypothetical protein